MNRKQERIVKQAIKLGKKKGLHEREELIHLKVQTAHPALRIFVGLIGLAIMAFPWQYGAEGVWTAVISIIGLVFVVIAIRGRKRELGELADSIGSGADIVGAVFEGVASALV